MTKVFIGIDPGLDGAIVAIPPKGIEVFIIPTFQVGTKREIDLPGIVCFFQGINQNYPYEFMMAAIEKVHSMPKQGVASSFKFGKGYGAILGILASLNISHFEVSPQTWKKAMMPDMPKEKESAILKVKQIEMAPITDPDSDSIFYSKKHRIAIAEAYLMARYAQKMEG